jgi:hypothetical protein
MSRAFDTPDRVQVPPCASSFPAEVPPVLPSGPGLSPMYNSADLATDEDRVGIRRPSAKSFQSGVSDKIQPLKHWGRRHP